MSTPALHLHPSPATARRRLPTPQCDAGPPGTEAALALAAQLDALLARLPGEDLTSPAAADGVQPVVEALRTAVTDLRHARAALAWVARPARPELPTVDPGFDTDQTAREALALKAAALGCSAEELRAELMAPHPGLPLVIP